MINRAIIRLSNFDKDEIAEIKKKGLKESHLEYMRKIYFGLVKLDTFHHQRMETVFYSSSDYEIKYYDFEENGQLEECIEFLYYLEFEDDIEHTTGGVLDLLHFIPDVDRWHIEVGLIGSAEADYNGMIDNGIDWTTSS